MLNICKNISIGSIRQGTLLNQIDEALLPEGAILLATEEGYIISEQDDLNNFITEE